MASVGSYWKALWVSVKVRLGRKLVRAGKTQTLWDGLGAAHLCQADGLWGTQQCYRGSTLSTPSPCKKVLAKLHSLHRCLSVRQNKALWHSDSSTRVRNRNPAKTITGKYRQQCGDIIHHSVSFFRKRHNLSSTPLWQRVWLGEKIKPTCGLTCWETGNKDNRNRKMHEREQIRRNPWVPPLHLIPLCNCRQRAK